jgi:hypothetical protein
VSTPEQLPQLSKADAIELSKSDPAALERARLAGQLNEVLAGRDPGSCPHCHRPMTDQAV